MNELKVIVKNILWSWWVAAFKKICRLFVALSMFGLLTCVVTCGCMNCYFRAPWTRVEIEECYQSTRHMCAMTVIASFPQMMSDNHSTSGSFMWANCFTIPFLGLPCLVDTACEACIDTVCLPADYFVASAREKKD